MLVLAGLGLKWGRIGRGSCALAVPFVVLALVLVRPRSVRGLKGCYADVMKISNEPRHCVHADRLPSIGWVGVGWGWAGLGGRGGGVGDGARALAPALAVVVLVLFLLFVLLLFFFFSCCLCRVLFGTGTGCVADVRRAFLLWFLAMIVPVVVFVPPFVVTHVLLF